MAATAAFRIDRKNGRLLVDLDESVFEEAEVSRFLNYLTLESLRKKSRMTEEEAAELADEIDHAVWEQWRRRFPEE